MEQLTRLNQFRLDADSNYQELEQIRDRHMNSLSRVDSKMDDYHNIIAAIRAEILLIIANNETALEIEILTMFNSIDNQVLFAKIYIPGFPAIYKSFSSIDYVFYNVSKDKSMNDFALQGRLKELVIEWLRNRQEWSGIFNQPLANAEQVMERFVNDEAVFHFFKRRPIMM
jgi:hypothetical protein